MSFNSTGGPAAIFKDGKLKPGIYKIQSLYTHTFLDIHERSRVVCCRPATVLAEGMGLWEIKPLGAGYSVKRVEPGRPEQFCVLFRLPADKIHPILGVTPYPMAWRFVVVDDEEHRGHEYVRGSISIKIVKYTKLRRLGSFQVILCRDGKPSGPAWRIWKLVPVNVEGTLTPAQLLAETLGQGTLPPCYDWHPTGQPPARVQLDETERDEFGTIVNEVTVVTTTSTVAARKRYRVEDT